MGDTECSNIISSSLGKVKYRAEQLEKVLKLLNNSRKKRVFYGDETNAMRNIYILLSVKEDDYRIMDRQTDGILPGKLCSCQNRVDIYRGYYDGLIKLMRCYYEGPT